MKPPSLPNESPLTVGALTREVERTLVGRGVLGPTLSARDVVAAVVDRPRFWPTLNAHALAEREVVMAVRAAVEALAQGAPLAYAVGRAAFRFLTLSVDERVLIPRPETEQLVELVLAAQHARSGGIAADVGTGSGAIALALAAEGNFERVIAADVSSDALDVARGNCEQAAQALRAPVEFRAGIDLVPFAAGEVDVLVSNPPYIAYEEAADLPSLVRDWEPSTALCCADDGLAVTRRIVKQAPRVLKAGGLLALEVDSRRAYVVRDEVVRAGSFRDVTVRRDYSGRDRFVLATRVAIV